MKPYTLLHPHDPAGGKPARSWPFVYLHAEAERANQEAQRAFGWFACAPDLVTAPEVPRDANGNPVSAPGQYPGVLYGLPAVVVIAGGSAGWHHGRVALLGDVAGMRHAMTPADWR